ncbi:MAG: DUF6291 domain-containing protein [Dysgonamonadaceae bacterium]|jgi:hypothetical protein|nr:DUF6291 domain-containing protein [Dysgonamonadaceae bacterium]
MKTNKKQKEEIMKEISTIKRDSFVFYRSYFEAIETLSMKNRLIAFEAIAKYALDREEAMDLPNGVLAILKMAIPNLDANHVKYCKRMKSMPQTSGEDTSAASEEESHFEELLKEEYKKNFTNNEEDSFNDKGGKFEP